MMTEEAAEALFASPLQPSENPTIDEVEGAVRRSLTAFGGARGCAAAVAVEYGDHPDNASARMRWALSLVRQRCRGRA